VHVGQIALTVVHHIVYLTCLTQHFVPHVGSPPLPQQEDQQGIPRAVQPIIPRAVQPSLRLTCPQANPQELLQKRPHHLPGLLRVLPLLRLNLQLQIQPTSQPQAQLHRLLDPRQNTLPGNRRAHRPLGSQHMHPRLTLTRSVRRHTRGQAGGTGTHVLSTTW